LQKITLVNRTNLFLFLSILLLSSNIYSQKQYATFGFHVEPIIPLEMFRIKSQTVVRENVTFNSKPLSGYTIGTHLSVELSPKFSLESGINYVTRNFLLDVQDGQFSDTIRMKADNFEIPFTLTYYVQLSERFFMGHSLGVSLQLIPSNLYTRNNERNQTYVLQWSFEQFSARKSPIIPTFKGGFGFEYRSKKDGYFYIGPVYHLFSELYRTNINYYHKENGKDISRVRMKTVGDYFGINLRYVFPPSDLLRKNKEK
jgi:hypothetical protein